MKKVVLSLAAVALLTVVSCKDANAEANAEEAVDNVEAVAEEAVENVEEAAEVVADSTEAAVEAVEEAVK